MFYFEHRKLFRAAVAEGELDYPPSLQPPDLAHSLRGLLTIDSPMIFKVLHG